MTHAESQDLLLDLAYGELDAVRAAEVEQHLSSCPECRKEKAALEEARRMAAPVRELEQPSAGFDERILRAARAQAQLEHDGNVGQVIEVTGSVRPLGVDVARIDAHGPVKARSAERPRPRWMVRTAVAGSVAAAAALALVVGNTLETRRNAERVAAAHSSDFEIRVQPAAPQVVDSALRDAEAKQRQKDEIEPRGLGGVPVAAPAQEKRHDAVAQMPPLRKRAAPGARMQGSGGDAAESQAKAAANAKKERAPVVDTVAIRSAVSGRRGTASRSACRGEGAIADGAERGRGFARGSHRRGERAAGAPCRKLPRRRIALSRGSGHAAARERLEHRCLEPRPRGRVSLGGRPVRRGAQGARRVGPLVPVGDDRAFRRGPGAAAS